MRLLDAAIAGWKESALDRARLPHPLLGPITVREMLEFEDELKNMTVSQGRLLIKLIDRETGHTSYELVKQLSRAKPIS